MLRRFVLLLTVLCSLVVVPVAAVSAQGLFTNACNAQGGVSQTDSSGCSNQQTEVAGSNGILAKITKIVMVVAGVAAIILIVVSGIFYALAEGDPSKINGAKNTLLGAIIGIVIILAAQGILQFVLGHTK